MKRLHLLGLLTFILFFQYLYCQEVDQIILNLNSQIKKSHDFIKDLTVKQTIILETEGMRFEEVSILYYKDDKKAKKTIEVKGKKMPEKLPDFDFFRGRILDEKDYEISLTGVEKIEGDECFKLSLKPRSMDEKLINGYLLVSTKDFGIVKYESYPLKKPSMVKELQIIQFYLKNQDGIWLPSKRVVNSLTNAIIKNVKSITIFEYTDYKINSGLTDEVFRGK